MYLVITCVDNVVTRIIPCRNVDDALEAAMIRLVELYPDIKDKDAAREELRSTWRYVAECYDAITVQIGSTHPTIVFLEPPPA